MLMGAPLTEESKVFTKVLVANRGEIALRVMRACHDLGVQAVAVYGEGELNAPHVRYAGEAFRIPSDRPLPYLDIGALIQVARQSGAEAIHPGYGFLAENAEFASACASAGIIFIGPSPSSISAMGDKVAARRVALAAGAPLVPGSDGPVDVAGARAFAEQYGYPIAIKAAAGGGGRGFRVAWSDGDVEEAHRGASGEAERYFSDGRVYVERYLDHPRHIEIQVFADRHGNCVAIGERDCSIQRRHQKLIEESPSPAIDAATRQRMQETAVKLAREVEYVGAGTVEFLFQDGDYYFLEMNTRIQVEHPVTEMISGLDLVAEQIRVAAGASLSFGSEIDFRGHAIECRINAEDPARGFAPAPGTVVDYRPPVGFGIRVDGAAEAGYTILPRYDSLIAKLIAWGRDRDEALRRLRRALRDFNVSGVPTTIGFHLGVVTHPEFANGDYDTRFLERHADLLSVPGGSVRTVSDSANEVGAVSERFVVEVSGKRFDVVLHGEQKESARRAPRLAASRRGSVASNGRGSVVSPIQGTVLRVAATSGQEIHTGDLICVIEAMKMENEISAPQNGVVSQLNVSEGDTVQTGAVLAVIDSPPE
jgi:acetyl-CoA/propionyl-CoA carboxylase biotin carboxyl carrier protein